MKRRQINKQALAALWSNHAIPTQRIADAMGISRAGLRWHVRRMGLPKRPSGIRPKYEPELLMTLWQAGVSSAEIASHFGMKNPSCVGAAAQKLGLPKRERGGKSGHRNGGWKGHTPISAILDQLIAERMAMEAAKSRIAMQRRQMVDHPSSCARG